MRGWIYRNIIFSPLAIFGEGVNISWHYIFTPDNIWWGSEYIVTLYFHSWQYLVRRVNISWHYIFTPGNIWWGGEYIVTLYFHPWQYLMRRVNISWHYISTPDNIWWGGEYIVTLYFHPWQYLVRRWIYRDIIFSLLTIFDEGVNISWHYIFTPGNIWWGVDISWHYIFTPDNIWWGGEHIVTLYFHPWQYVVRGWIYRDIFTPDDVWSGGDYIVILHYHSWHYPRIWHWRWSYLNIFTIQIWLCSDTSILLLISMYSPHETWGVEVIIFKHGTLFAAET